MEFYTGLSVTIFLALSILWKKDGCANVAMKLFFLVLAIAGLIIIAKSN